MTHQAAAAGFPLARGVQLTKELAVLNMREAAAASQLSELWSDTFLTNAGINAGASTGYTYRGAANYDAIRDAVTTNVKSLMKFDGADGATNPTDSAPSARTWTAGGNAQLDTAEKKFGTASALFDGTGDYFDTPDSADFDIAAGDFTIEAFIRLNAAGQENIICGQNDNTSADQSFAFLVNAANHIFGQVRNGAGVATNCEGTTALTTGVWYHVAFVRTGNNLKVFLDGVLENTVAFNDTVKNSASKVAIGRLGEWNFYYFNGWIDSFRFTKGEALYTSNFTAPTSELTDRTATQAVIRSVAITMPAAVTSVILFADVTGGPADLYEISTDNGSTWTTIAAANVGKIVSVPSGTQLVIKITISGSMELESWGVAAT